MKPLEIKIARVRAKLTQRYMAYALGISVTSYAKKERGIVRFTDTEKVKLTEILGLTFEQFNDYFYDGNLPIGRQDGWADLRDAR